MSQLRFFLGTEFDKLFFDKQNGEKSLGSLLDEDIGFANIKNMENALMKRLKNLASYINGREIQQEIFMNLVYNTAVLNIQTQHQKSLAILGAPVKRPEIFDSDNLEKIFKNLERKTDGAIGIPFDLFFCAGGARDQIRTRFIG
ncbi:unnamed protein product [Meloidogyne enterolobii]|uniref:Uncharacterized protein n=1 Tax=Meloidogyne enterolobii TaxID=390850 RepID=A0ACB1AH30_MELEN